jgi:hypothetical protein
LNYGLQFGYAGSVFPPKVQPEVVLIILGLRFFTGLDVYYVAKGLIWPVYLADAAVLTFLIVLWLWWWLRQKPALQAAEK